MATHCAITLEANGITLTPMNTAYIPDTDPQETREWIDSLQSLIANEGEERAEFLLQQLFDVARRSCRGLKFNATTAYTNTIPLAEQPPYPGDLALEDRTSTRLNSSHRT